MILALLLALVLRALTAAGIAHNVLYPIDQPGTFVCIDDGPCIRIELLAEELPA